MNLQLVKKAFDEFKSVKGIDYSIIYTDEYGDCNTCVNAKLCDIYGEDSNGIYLKHWEEGMNEEEPIEELDTLFIAHDITEEQGKELYKIFSKYFVVEPKEYCSNKCYKITPIEK